MAASMSADFSGGSLHFAETRTYPGVSIADGLVDYPDELRGFPKGEREALADRASSLDDHKGLEAVESLV